MKLRLIACAALLALATTLETLVREHRLSLPGARGASPAETMRAAARAGVERALAADAERWRVAREAGKDKPDACLSDEQKARVRRVMCELGKH